MPGIVLDYGNGTTEYIYDERPLDEQKAQLLAEVAERRWQACQYFTFDGERTQADGAISPITGAVVARQFFHQTYGVEAPPQIWKLNTNAFRELTTVDLVTLGFAAQSHISACFLREQELVAQIAAVTDAHDLDNIDYHTGWPEE